MNYIGQIRGFWRSHEKNSFSVTEIALYYHLVEVCNICQWENPFKRNNAKIQAHLSMSYNTLKNARNKLQQAGLITFKSVNGSANVSYTLSNFDEVSDEVGNEVSDEVTNEVGSEVFTSKDKLNKTSINTIPPLPPKGEKGEYTSDPVTPPEKKQPSPRPPFQPPTPDEVREYCQSRGNSVDAALFCDFYQSKNWMVGKNKMKDWRASVRTWEAKRDNAPERPKSKTERARIELEKAKRMIGYGQ